SLSHWRPTPGGEESRTRPPQRGPGPLAYSRPAGARVALLRSPILPPAGGTIGQRGSSRQPRITRGGSRSSGRSDMGLTADLVIVLKMRTFLLLPDTGTDGRLPVAGPAVKLPSRPGRWPDRDRHPRRSRP